jgi:hypothetical protein
LGTGQAFEDLKFTIAIAPLTRSGIVLQTCEAITIPKDNKLIFISATFSTTYLRSSEEIHPQTIVKNKNACNKFVPRI